MTINGDIAFFALINLLETKFILQFKWPKTFQYIF